MCARFTSKTATVDPPNQGYTFLSFPGSVWSSRRASMPCIYDESLSKHFRWTSRSSWRILGWSSHLVGVQEFFPIHRPSTGTSKTFVFFFVHLPACVLSIWNISTNLWKKTMGNSEEQLLKRTMGGCQLMEQIAMFDWGLWPPAPKKNEKSPAKLTWRFAGKFTMKEDVISYWKNGKNFPATAMLVNSWGLVKSYPPRAPTVPPRVPSSGTKKTWGPWRSWRRHLYNTEDWGGVGCCSVGWAIWRDLEFGVEGI